jgi:hypothetical protein
MGCNFSVGLPFLKKNKNKHCHFSLLWCETNRETIKDWIFKIDVLLQDIGNTVPEIFQQNMLDCPVVVDLQQGLSTEQACKACNAWSLNV